MFNCYCSQHKTIFWLLGDKQARRVVYTMVYATPSYLVYLLATKIFMLASITLISLSIGWPTVGMSDQP